MAWCTLHKKGLVVGSTILGTKIISSVFNFYYVKVFIDRYHMSDEWFQLSQIIFAIWNAVNDPWFGYLQDTRTTGWMSVRRKCILYGALPWVISFLIPWFPWADYSQSNDFICFLQGLSALCLTDTFFTFCLLAHCALLTEYAESDEERLIMVKYMGAAGIVGSSSVFFAEYISTGLSVYPRFQEACVLMAIVALGLFAVTGIYADTKYDEMPQREPPSGSYLSLTKDIFRNKNFLLFVAMNFMQELHITYIIAFAKIFSEQMIPEAAISTSTHSMLLGALMILPQAVIVVISPVVMKYGVYMSIMTTFYIKILVGLLMFVSRLGRSVYFLVYLIVDFTLSKGAFGFFTIILSDIAVEDMTANNRRKPISSMVYGSNALVVKPALSIAPMIVTALMSHCGYDAVKAGTASDEEKTNLQNMIFSFACFAPVLIGLAQILIWRKYPLSNRV